ncbi:MAG: shikimate dehydrogenase [Pseudomonadota bacterium]|nr:shikimate dehydrogenase [Pseudomonadota bacterium]
MRVSGKTKIAGVMGWPISHSRSPLLHGYWLREYGIDGSYLPFPVEPANLKVALRALPILGISGTNLTVPHKEAALEICDRVDKTAWRIGAVNTVIVEQDGTLSGSNTDAFGFIENLKSGSNWHVKDGPVVVLGAGGAARAVVAALVNHGVTEIRILNRTLDRASALAATFGENCCAAKLTDANDALKGAVLLVNTTTLGMIGQPPLELSIETLPRGATVNDIVYAPLQTNLLRVAAARGNPVVDGLGMLLHQARPGFAAWFGVEPKVTKSLRNTILEDLNA